MDAQETVLVRALLIKLEAVATVLPHHVQFTPEDKATLRAYLHDIKVLLQEASASLTHDRKAMVRYAADIVAGE